MSRSRRHPTALTAKVWRLTTFGAVRVVIPTNEQLAAIDARWPGLRKETDWHHAWRWETLAAKSAEVMAVVNDTGQILGIWCSAKAKPITLPEGPFYRPDYLEAAPDARGREVGAFLVFLIAARAIEMGASSVVLGTWAFHRPFYVGLGAVERCPSGWNVERNLVPFVFDVETVGELKRLLDSLERHGQTPSNI